MLAALAADVTEATVRKWASRGKLTRYGGPGRAEYDLDELYELVERRLSRAKAGSGPDGSQADAGADPGG